MEWAIGSKVCNAYILNAVLYNGILDHQSADCKKQSLFLFQKHPNKHSFLQHTKQKLTNLTFVYRK